MQKPRTFLASATLCLALTFPAIAQEEPNIDTVVATVNGTEITLGHMIVAHAGLPDQYKQLPDEVLFEGILDQLVQQTALADTFEGELPKRAALSLENEQRSVTAAEAVELAMAAGVSEEDLQKAYEEQYTNAEQEMEYNASHILVETEEAAKTIKEELDNGADFAELAKEKSTGPSGPGGGSLGWFGKGMMVPSFEAAVIALAPGAVSDPVQTQFGWHVIKLNDSRQTEAPALETVREELELQLRQIAVQETIENVTAAAAVERSQAEGIDPAIIKNIEWLE